MLTRRIILTLVTMICLAAVCFADPLAGVPKAIIDFDANVSQWWYEHPLNPESPVYNPDIASPEYTVQLTAGQSIGDAINSLPGSGGTIILGQGSYVGNFNIIGKNNIHIIAPDGATINVSASIVVAGCSESINYSTYNLCFKQRNAACMDCWQNKIENIYFKNITFDGGNIVTNVVGIKTSDGVMFDNCVFQNVHDPLTGHGGLVYGHAGCDSVWFRNCHFVGSQRWALYLDGGRGCGLIGCTVESNFVSGILWLCNEDFSLDENNDGVFTKEEKRNMMYSVVYNTHFKGGLETTISATGNDLLVRKNTVDTHVNNFCFFNPKTSLINANLIHYCYGLYVEENVTASVGNFVHFNTNLDSPSQWDNKSHLGRYVVRGNRVTGSYGNTILHTGIVDGPNIECGNCWNDPGCAINGGCADVLPDTESPEIPKNASALKISAVNVSLEWDPSQDNFGTIGYYVYRNGQPDPVADITDTSFTDTCLQFGTEYSYQIAAYDDAGNISNLTAPLFISTNAPGDLDDSGLVYTSDFVLFVLDWLKQGDCPDADFNYDMIVNFEDFALLVGEYWTGYDSTPPTVPANLTTALLGDVIVELNWTPSAHNFGIAYYEIFRDGEFIGTSETESYMDKDLELMPDTAYSYTVRAVSIFDIQSELSDVLNVTTQPLINLIVNNSFEEGLTNWGGYGQYAIDSTIGRTGGKSLKTTGVTGGYGEQNSGNFTYPLVPGRTYKASAWMRLENVAGNNGATARFVQLSPSVEIYFGNWKTGNTNGNWIEVVREFTVPENYTGGRFDVVWDHSSGTAWFDDVSLTAYIPPQIENLIRNPSFEEGLTYWSKGGSGVGQLDTTGLNAYEGANSYKTIGSGAGAYLQQGTGNFYQNLEPDTTYIISCWVKLDNISAPDNEGLRIRFVQLSPSVIVYSTGWQLGDTAGGWIEVTRSFKTAANYVSGRLDLQWEQTTGNAWFDMVTLKKAE
ncbi:MAG: hypothetical protein A2Y10_17825 [Planctomycetes bacterium GWF2_41_51]|nr:MAG: hypothetical protein A2Y10_17825 [Planctomycetes bacterium GWF2_41_51]